MGHFILGNYGYERSGRLLELVQLVLIIGGSLLDNWAAAVLHSGNCKNWVTLPLLFDQFVFRKSNFLYTSTQNPPILHEITTVVKRSPLA